MTGSTGGGVGSIISAAGYLPSSYSFAASSRNSYGSGAKPATVAWTRTGLLPSPISCGVSTQGTRTPNGSFSIVSNPDQPLLRTMTSGTTWNRQLVSNVPTGSTVPCMTAEVCVTSVAGEVHVTGGTPSVVVKVSSGPSVLPAEFSATTRQWYSVPAAKPPSKKAGTFTCSATGSSPAGSSPRRISKLGKYLPASWPYSSSQPVSSPSGSTVKCSVASWLRSGWGERYWIAGGAAAAATAGKQAKHTRPNRATPIRRTGEAYCQSGALASQR